MKNHIIRIIGHLNIQLTVIGMMCLLLLSVTNPSEAQAPPPAAAAAGYTKLAFFDDFNSTATIDMEDTRTAGFNWYRARPFGWNSTPKDSIKVVNGYLVINSIGGPNYGIGTTCKSDGKVIGFSATEGAYFEASISFDPDITGAKGWPSFWSMADEHLWYNIGKNFMECDFMEYIVVEKIKTRYIGALHWWVDITSKPRVQKHNLGNWFIETGETDWKNSFQTMGTLWIPGQTINYYFNNILKTENPYTKYPEMSGGDNQHWPVILGSDGWPMKVDWVRVWIKE